MNKICVRGSDQQGKKILSERFKLKKTSRKELGHIGRKSNEIHYDR